MTVGDVSFDSCKGDTPLQTIGQTNLLDVKMHHGWENGRFLSRGHQVCFSKQLNPYLFSSGLIIEGALVLMTVLSINLFDVIL